MLILAKLFTRTLDPTKLECAAEIGLHGKEIEELILKACEDVFSPVNSHRPDLLPCVESIVNQRVCRNVYSEALKAFLEEHEPLAQKSEGKE